MEEQITVKNIIDEQNFIRNSFFLLCLILPCLCHRKKNPSSMNKVEFVDVVEKKLA
jgi:hypothetical protein